MELARVLKCQDLSPTRGMATVSEESGIHLNTGKLNIFSGCLRASSLARKRMLPACEDEPVLTLLVPYAWGEPLGQIYL